MRAKDLVKRLTAFGLDPREALVFYHLSALGPSRAAEVARASGVKRTEVYRVMETLESKGLLEKTLERPRRFVPVPVDEALGRILEARDREMAELRRERTELQAEWPRVASGTETVSERFSVHHGRTQIRGLLHRMIEGATEEIALVTLKRGLARLDSMGVVDALAARARAGIIVRVLTEIDETNRQTVDAIARDCSVRHIALSGYHQVLVVDGREIALFVSVDPLVSTSEAGETVLWLNAPDFILAQRSIFDAMWETGLDDTRRTQELDTGEVAESVAVVRGRWTRYEKMKEMLYRAKKDVLLATTAADAARLERAGVRALLSRRATDGARVRILVFGGPPMDLPGAQVRTSRAPMPLGALAVDDREFLAVLGADADAESVTHEHEWAVWCAVRDDVRWGAGLLEDLWSDAA